MRIALYIIILFFIKLTFANEITIIELHNKSIDQVLIENSENESNQQSKQEIISEDIQNNKDSINLEEKLKIIKEIDETINTNKVEELNNIWQDINKEEILYLVSNINKIHSSVLKNEIISTLASTTIVPNGFTQDDFNRFLINNLLKLGDRKKAYEIIQSIDSSSDSINNSYYKQFTLNYLLSTYNLSEACNYRESIKDLDLNSKTNFFLKIDIFCLILEEKFDQANLLNALLIETEKIQDDYFQFLLSKLIDFENESENVIFSDNTSDIFLYSAMHRIANLPLNKNFFNIDPINLSMPIILSFATDINLRLKAAHFAFLENLINIDSLSALYQTVDFTYDQLNNPSEVLNTLNGNIEIGMAYFYQLINVQLLPITRLEAIIQFWEFAEKNNLESIAYQISKKSLNTIEPSSEISMYGPSIAKAYIMSKDYENANKWLLFAESAVDDKLSISKLNSSKLLLNLYAINEEENLTDILYENLKYMSTNLVDNNEEHSNKIEVLNLIFSILNNENENPFKIQKKIQESKEMPALYLLESIRNASKKNNQIRLLFNIILSIDGKKWTDIHPEHLRIILLNLQNYKEGTIINNILLEVLEDNKII
ncbi:hypothetical protein OAJ89_01890 [Alphaproteobacteria bacterium]|nr:hypothetical protein [Alphaproteobacteria bacterium]